MSGDVPEFKNVVVVRFSVREKSFERKFLSNDRAREGWFNFRAELYEASLGASLAAQSVRPQAIFLYFDSGDAELVGKYFSRLDFTPIFSGQDHERLMGEQVLRQGLSRQVVLSRIDSDDIVERHYFSKINSVLIEHHLRGTLAQRSMVVCRSGYRTNFIKMQRVNHVSPPFISQYFSDYSGEGAYFNHTKLSTHDTPQILDESAEWLQIIHGTNVANKFKPSTTSDWNTRHLDVNESQFGPIQSFDPAWFQSWSGMVPIEAHRFASDRVPLYGLGAKVRFALRRLFGQA